MRYLLGFLIGIQLAVASGCGPCAGKTGAEKEVCEAEPGSSGTGGQSGPSGSGGSEPDPIELEDKVAAHLLASEVVATEYYSDDAIKFDLYGCAHLGDSSSVLCVLTAEGSGFDWDLKLKIGFCDQGTLIAIDDKGIEYKASAVKIAMATQEAIGCGPKKLVEGTVTEVRIQFDDIHSDAPAFTRVSMPVSAGTSQLAPAIEVLEFRDVEIE